ncbi:MAG: hypothetical protein IJM37_00110 [Lachnospiraceae bacterium]|nr:hypothetical protein [Lachnospiraceae bacterium]
MKELIKSFIIEMGSNNSLSVVVLVLIPIIIAVSLTYIYVIKDYGDAINTSDWKLMAKNVISEIFYIIMIFLFYKGCTYKAANDKVDILTHGVNRIVNLKYMIIVTVCAAVIVCVIWFFSSFKISNLIKRVKAFITYIVKRFWYRNKDEKTREIKANHAKIHEECKIIRRVGDEAKKVIKFMYISLSRFSWLLIFGYIIIIATYSYLRNFLDSHQVDKYAVEMAADYWELIAVSTCIAAIVLYMSMIVITLRSPNDIVDNPDLSNLLDKLKE